MWAEIYLPKSKKRQITTTESIKKFDYAKFTDDESSRAKPYFFSNKEGKNEICQVLKISGE